MKRVLFVCMGNICRSPLAEGVFRHLAADEAEIEIDSAGTHSYHVGQPPDDRAIAAGRRRGFDIGSLRARVVSDADFERFDLIVAMDRDNLSLLRRRAAAAHRERLRLFMHFAGEGDVDVPDPYYGGDTAFEHALDLIERAARGLLEELRRG